MAKAFINLNRPIGNLSPLVFSHFIEHMHRCLYTGVYEENSPLSDTRGIRQDVFQAARNLRAGNLRWPGGNFVSGYHWEDGVGPLENRPARMELAWHGIESNRFGTDEFIQYCRDLQTEPYICANLGTGTLDEARNWVEYCNGTSDTFYANLRRKNGHAEPYRVKYWGLGNEMHGVWQQSTRSAQDYATYAREAAKLMKWVDPSIQLVACGHDGISEWDWTVLQALAPLVEYYSIHIYTGSDDYYSNVFLPHHTERCMRSLAGMIESVRFRQHIHQPILIAYDEWNVWNTRKAIQENGYEQHYDMGDAVAVATYLNCFIRSASILGMANLAQMVNVLGTMLTRPDGLCLQSIYYPLVLYAEHCGRLALDCYLDPEPQDLHSLAPDASPEAPRVADLGPFSYLDITATHSPELSKVTVCVTNRHISQAQTADITVNGSDFTGQGLLSMVTSAQPGDANDFDRPNAIQVLESFIDIDRSCLKVVIPAHSVAVLRWTIK